MGNGGEYDPYTSCETVDPPAGFDGWTYETIGTPSTTIKFNPNSTEKYYIPADCCNLVEGGTPCTIRFHRDDPKPAIAYSSTCPGWNEASLSLLAGNNSSILELAHGESCNWSCNENGFMSQTEKEMFSLSCDTPGDDLTNMLQNELLDILNCQGICPCSSGG